MPLAVPRNAPSRPPPPLPPPFADASSFSSASNDDTASEPSPASSQDEYEFKRKGKHRGAKHVRKGSGGRSKLQKTGGGRGKLQKTRRGGRAAPQHRRGPATGGVFKLAKKRAPSNFDPTPGEWYWIDVYNIVRSILTRVHRVAMDAHLARAAARMLPAHPPRAAGRPQSTGPAGAALATVSGAADATTAAKRHRDGSAAPAGELADAPTDAALLAEARELAAAQAKRIKLLEEQVAYITTYTESTCSQSLRTVLTASAGGGAPAGMGGGGGAAAAATAAAKTATADSTVGEDKILQPATLVRLRAQRQQLDVLKASMDFEAAAAVKEST